jgi:hypothetical protein
MTIIETYPLIGNARLDANFQRPTKMYEFRTGKSYNRDNIKQDSVFA